MGAFSTSAFKNDVIWYFFISTTIHITLHMCFYAHLLRLSILISTATTYFGVNSRGTEFNKTNCFQKLTITRMHKIASIQSHLTCM